ncbi:MAG: DUF4276 family protein [Spirochaetales bacterium]|nr:DUF4276 family protein [Spirochaetales bacterium]
MSDFIEIIVIVEGKTEKIFINSILKDNLADRNIYMTPIIISKPGEKGGDIKFSRALKDITIHMKQRADTFVSLFIDYYGLKPDWPGFINAKKEEEPAKIASIINDSTHLAVNTELSAYRSDIRFIPHITVHEFEALLFSDASSLASELHVDKSDVDKIIDQFGDPEKIDDSPDEAPSKRLERLYPKYKKTTTGIIIARNIGIDAMRKKCRIFNDWLKRIESHL